MAAPLIVSLDTDSAGEALALVAALGPQADHYKVGLQLLAQAGPELVHTLVSEGKHVFLDLKLHEIPNAAAGAARVAGRLGVSMITVHATAGSAVMRAVVEAAAAYPSMRVLALTVITSLTDEDLPSIGIAGTVQAQVERLARLAADAGCHGVVASAHEAALLRRVLPRNALIVCAGVQLVPTSRSDQARVAGPAEAARAGATHVVMGRAITLAPDPLAAYREALEAFNTNTPR